MHKYNFAGQVIQTRYRHTVPSEYQKFLDYFYTYDHRGRLIKEELQITGGTKTIIAGYNYNEAGEMTEKYHHSQGGGDFLQCMDYTYNIRGWLKSINDPANFQENDQFGLELYYEKRSDNSSGVCNGNISEMKWGTVNNPDLAYKYTYDASNRLDYADFVKSGLSIYALDADYSYDDNGNLTSLERRGYDGTAIDQISMQYMGNHIISLSDSKGDVVGTTDYAGTSSPTSISYDYNGNVDVETQRLIDVLYNTLNLPTEISWLGQNKVIDYFYTFDGEKLRKNAEDNGTITVTDYCGPFVYETVSGTRSLKYIVITEGRAIKDGGNYIYEYNLKDHLGNTRCVIKDSSGIVLMQENHYYPYGMEISQFSSGFSTNKYQYNGKELQDDFDLGWYDYGARFYDPQLGRFHTQDRFAEDFSDRSPYHYASNNPISFIDINGDSTYIFNIATGAMQMVSDVGGNEQQIVNFVNEDGSALMINDKAVSSVIDGESVFVTPTSDGTLVSSYDPLAGLSNDYNSNSGYEYTAADLKTRHKLKGTSLEYQVAAREAGGNAAPIAGKTAYDEYVKKWGTDKAFMYGIEGGYFSNMLPGGSSDILSGAQRAISSSSKSIRSFSPNFNNVKSIKKIQPRAPKGGITINGKFYKGGQFIPRVN